MVLLVFEKRKIRFQTDERTDERTDKVIMSLLELLIIDGGQAEGLACVAKVDL